MDNSWQPTASIENLKKRAKILEQIRGFFKERNVLEVDTPLMASAPVTDPFLTALETRCSLYRNKTFYLQTSPEYAMKRLLAAGSGSIYQICKAFRDDESGRLHNPEFTMLEWYRVGFTDDDLIVELDDLLQLVLKSKPLQKLSYRKAFEQFLHFNPHQVGLEQLQAMVHEKIGDIKGMVPNKDTYLQLLMSEIIEPNLGLDAPVVITDFPASQAALAKTRLVEQDLVAGRFELYIKGIELANGYYELQDPVIQRERFETDLAKRTAEGIKTVPMDEKLLSAIEYGLPECSGVALGLDRLILLALNASHIKDVITFTMDRA